ncbi:hypothetical protein Tco_0934349 [Tanacetum coccineum]
MLWEWRGIANMDFIQLGGNSRVDERELVGCRVFAGEDNEDIHDFGSVETEFPAIVFNNTLTSEAALSCEPMHSLYGVFVKRIQRIRYRCRYGVSWGMDTAYRLPDLQNEIDELVEVSGNLKVLES